jgi:hypothetical protein
MPFKIEAFSAVVILSTIDRARVVAEVTGSAGRVGAGGVGPGPGDGPAPTIPAVVEPLSVIVGHADFR